MGDAMKDGIIKRGATYSYVVRERDSETGKTKPRWVSGFASPTAAKKARNAARVAVDRGTYVAPQDLTVGAWLDTWMLAHEVELRASTARAYRGNIDRYLRPVIGAERVQSLSPTKLSIVFKNMYEHGGMNGKPLSPRTVEFTRAILRKAMDDAVIDRLIEVNPVVGTKRPKTVKPKHLTWTGEQLRTFIDSLDDERLAPMVAVSAGTGMRRGELLSLRWSDADLDAGVLSIERSVSYLDRVRTYTTPKNHERRKVTIDPHTLAALKAWRKAQAADRLKFGAAYNSAEDLIFGWEDGSPLVPDYVSKLYDRLQASARAAIALTLTEAGKSELEAKQAAELTLPRLKLHELRHTHATLLLREGVPVHVVAKRLGHKDPSVTLNVYADAVPDDDDRAVDVFSRAVWGA